MNIEKRIEIEKKVVRKLVRKMKAVTIGGGVFAPRELKEAAESYEAMREALEMVVEKYGKHMDNFDFEKCHLAITKADSL